MVRDRDRVGVRDWVRRGLVRDRAGVRVGVRVRVRRGITSLRGGRLV